MWLQKTHSQRPPPLCTGRKLLANLVGYQHQMWFEERNFIVSDVSPLVPSQAMNWGLTGCSFWCFCLWLCFCIVFFYWHAEEKFHCCRCEQLHTHPNYDCGWTTTLHPHWRGVPVSIGGFNQHPDWVREYWESHSNGRSVILSLEWWNMLWTNPFSPESSCQRRNTM